MDSVDLVSCRSTCNPDEVPIGKLFGGGLSVIDMSSTSRVGREPEDHELRRFAETIALRHNVVEEKDGP